MTTVFTSGKSPAQDPRICSGQWQRRIASAGGVFDSAPRLKPEAAIQQGQQHLVILCFKSAIVANGDHAFSPAVKFPAVLKHLNDFAHIGVTLAWGQVDRDIPAGELVPDATMRETVDVLGRPGPRRKARAIR